MVSEFIIAGTGLAVYRACEKYYKNNKWKTKELKADIKTFENVCTKNETQFYLLDGSITKYGTRFIASLKENDFEKLEKLKNKFEIGYKTDIEIEQNDNKCTATIDIIRNKLNDYENRYEPIEVKPYEVYIGETNKFDSMVLNMNDCPHLICSGSSGVGKSEELKLIMANSIHFNDETKLNIHICNVGNTGDFDDFINCKQVKSFTEKYEDIYKQFEDINHTYENRIETFRRYGCKNIKQYNYKFKNSVKKMPYVWLVIDEIASLYPSSSIDQYKEIKEELFNALCDMGRRFRKVGIFLVLGIQRPSKTVFNPELKMNINIKVAFNQNNTASSLVAIDSEKVAKIGRRKFLVEYDCEEHWSRSLYIDDNIIREIIKDSIVDNRTAMKDFNTFLNKPSKELKEEVKATKGKSKDKGKAIPSKVSKKIVELEVATEEIKESKSRVKNIEVIEVKSSDYRVENGKILLNMRRVEG